MLLFPASHSLPQTVQMPWARPTTLKALYLLALLSSPSLIEAQHSSNLTVISPANTSAVLDPATVLVLGSQSDERNAVIPILALRNSSATPTIFGNVARVSPATEEGCAPSDIALISCDDDQYHGNLQAADVYEYVTGATSSIKVAAVILYSQKASSCVVNGTSNYSLVYTTTNISMAEKMINAVNALGDGVAHGTIESTAHLYSGEGASEPSAAGNSTTSGDQQPPGPATPSTAVAMIILYSITGIITALFLIIIITGAVRAHRHPERYGPRNAVGRPRQSRARGLARAMLETIPIVKFNDPTDPANKPADVELQEHASSEVVPSGQQQPDEPARAQSADKNEAPARDETRAIEGEALAESGIAAAEHGDSQLAAGDNHQGCSICTEDFRVGEDQRVLPCDHRFHPMCVDPWLLNVSGTCPLCRIDLRGSRPSLDQDSEAGDGDSESMAPPLADHGEAGGRGTSVGRAILMGLMGTRPERTTREDRVRALRQYRAQQAVAAVQEQVEPHEAESSVGRRLRNAFRIRTRTTGERDDAQTDSGPTTQPLSS